MGQEVITSETDLLGSFARVSVDTSLYSEIAIFKAVYWYTNRYYLYLSRNRENGRMEIEIRPKDLKNEEDLTSVCREFCNSLIDYKVRQQVIEETAAIRDSLIKKAFFEGQNNRVHVPVKSNESALPLQGQSYRSDPLNIFPKQTS